MLACDTSFPQLLHEASKDLLGYVSRLDFELVVFQDGAPSLLHESEYRRTGFNCKNLRIASFYRVRKLLISKCILLIAHPYVQFAQTQ